MALEAVSSRNDAVANYEESKLREFNKHFQRDLELAAKKRQAKIDPKVLKAIDCIRAGKRKEAFEMIDKGIVDANATDSFGRTLLMIGAEIGDSRLCDGLLRRGADINQRNKFNGATVLHFAYQYEHDSLGLSLVARGADDTIRAIDGRTCYQLRDDEYDLEAADLPAAGMEAPAKAPPPRRDMNGDGKKPARRKDAGGKESRRVSMSNGAYDKMGDPNPRYDKMGDPYGDMHPPGAVPGGKGDKYHASFN
jgi:hypothetical protein